MKYTKDEESRKKKRNPHIIKNKQEINKQDYKRIRKEKSDMRHAEMDDWTYACSRRSK